MPGGRMSVKKGLETTRNQRKKLDATRKKLAEKAGELRLEENFEEAIKLYEQAADISKELGDPYREQLYWASARSARAAEANHLKILEQTREDFEGLIQKGMNLVAAKNIDGAAKTLEEVMKFPLHVRDETLVKKLTALIETTKQEKIRSTILDLGTKFTRLQVVEIAEKCGVPDDALIAAAIEDMIARGQIAAEYFKSTQAVAFNQQANIQERDKFAAELERAFSSWGTASKKG